MNLLNAIRYLPAVLGLCRDIASLIREAEAIIKGSSQGRIKKAFVLSMIQQSLYLADKLGDAKLDEATRTVVIEWISSTIDVLCQIYNDNGVFGHGTSRTTQ